MRKCIVAASAGGLILGAGVVFVGVLLTENAELLRHLQETEELLRSERQAATEAEARHSSELLVPPSYFRATTNSSTDISTLRIRARKSPLLSSR
jgi:hypothetical protein